MKLSVKRRRKAVCLCPGEQHLRMVKHQHLFDASQPQFLPYVGLSLSRVFLFVALVSAFDMVSVVNGKRNK